MLWIVLYVWAAVWTGVLMRSKYERHEPHKIIGSVVVGALWPLLLPVYVFFEYFNRFNIEEDEDV
jgi:hypothetical protein